MARKSQLAEDLAALAAAERSRLGEPPAAEELIALRDGKLSEEEAERLRDRLAVDPEWASIYLDLQSEPAALAADAPAGADDVDEAWRALSSRLERPAVLPFRRRPAGRALQALAAVVIVALGVVWLLIPTVTAGDYFPVEVPQVEYRGGSLTMPRDAAGLEFHADASALTGRVVVELRDAEDDLIRRETFLSGRIVFRVPASKLARPGAYRLTARPVGTPADQAPIDWVFELVFED